MSIQNTIESLYDSNQLIDFLIDFNKQSAIDTRKRILGMYWTQNSDTINSILAKQTKSESDTRSDTERAKAIMIDHMLALIRSICESKATEQMMNLKQALKHLGIGHVNKTIDRDPLGTLRSLLYSIINAKVLTFDCCLDAEDSEISHLVTRKSTDTRKPTTTEVGSTEATITREETLLTIPRDRNVHYEKAPDVMKSWRIAQANKINRKAMGHITLTPEKVIEYVNHGEKSHEYDFTGWFSIDLNVNHTVDIFKLYTETEIPVKVARSYFAVLDAVLRYFDWYVLTDVLTSIMGQSDTWGSKPYTGRPPILMTQKLSETFQLAQQGLELLNSRFEEVNVTDAVESLKDGINGDVFNKHLNDLNGVAQSITTNETIRPAFEALQSLLNNFTAKP